MLQRIIDGRTDLVWEYLDQGNAATSTDGNGVPLIRWCAYYGDVSAIKRLLSRGASLEDLGENLDLNGAAFHGHWPLCQYLLENGADPNFPQAENGETPLHAALCKPNQPSNRYIAQLLVHYGADPNSCTIPGKESGAFMRDVRTRGETPLHRAAAFADAKTIEVLIEAGADKTLKDSQGDTPISWASWHLRPGSILALLAHGEHRIHPLHVERLQSDHGFGHGGGSMSALLGEVHFVD